MIYLQPNNMVSLPVQIQYQCNDLISSNHHPAINYGAGGVGKNLYGLVCIAPDSGYPSTIVSLEPSAQSSCLPSRCNSPRKDAKQPMETGEKSTSLIINSNKQTAKPPFIINNYESSVHQTTLTNAPPIADSETDEVISSLLHAELESCRNLIDDFSWLALEEYKHVQEQLTTFQETMKDSFNQSMTQIDYNELDQINFTKADNLVNVIDNVWNVDGGISTEDSPTDNDTDDDRCLTGRHNDEGRFDPHAAMIPDDGSELSDFSDGRVPPPIAIAKSEPQQHAQLLQENNAISKDQQQQDTIKPFKKPMQVHSQTDKPTLSDAIRNIRYKTKSCVHFDKFEHCPAGDDCHFAHGLEELRKPKHHPKFRTQICIHFLKSGKCPFRKKCYFRHSLD